MSMTKEQALVVERLSTPRDGFPHLLTEAVAGSGKTYTLVEGVRALPFSTKVICTAFNAKVAKELGSRMPRNAHCVTTHKLGLDAWRGRIGNIEVLAGRSRDDPGKTQRISEELGITYKMFPGLRQLIGLAKAGGIIPNSFNKEGLMPDTPQSWQNLMDLHDIECGKEEPISMARAVLEHSIRWSLEGRVDFDDMLYMPALWGAPFPQCDILMIDEAQDIAPVQRRMFDRMLTMGKKGTRFLAVGDRYQAIYGFRGADFGSMDEISQTWKPDQLQLSYTFRCGTRIVKEAQQFVPHIKAKPGAHEGAVNDYGGNWDAKDFKPGDAILCRTNKPLVAMAFYLIQQGVAAKMLGKEIGKSLIALVNRMKARDVEDLENKLLDYAHSQSHYLRGKGLHHQAEILEDKVDCLLFIIEKTGKGPYQLKDYLDKLFTDEGGRNIVILSTIHKAKGLEWDRVWFLNRSGIPGRWAKSEGQIQQEHNLIYVAVTRARNELNYIEE